MWRIHLTVSAVMVIIFIGAYIEDKRTEKWEQKEKEERWK